jgi:hypothetical protein
LPRRYLFNCNDWLADYNGGTERYLRALALEDEDEASSLLKNNFNRKLYDDHLWLSVGYRKNKSNFTRIQRLSTCLAILFLGMVANAMWYNTGSDTPAQNAISIGPISFTVQEIYTSIMSSCILVPPILLITTLFVKAEPKRSSSNSNNNNKSKLSGSWPHWCAYIAWALEVLSVLVAGFITLLYSFQWGGEASKAWLTAFLMLFASSVLLIQPIQVRKQYCLCYCNFQLALSRF